MTANDETPTIPPSPTVGDVITTAGELDGLPVGSVVRLDVGLVAGREAQGWGIAGYFGTQVIRDTDLPVTLLWRPDAPPAARSVNGPRDLAGARVGDHYGDGELVIRWRPDAPYAPLGVNTIGHWSIDTTLDQLLDAIVAAGGPDPRVNPDAPPAAANVPPSARAGVDREALALLDDAIVRVPKIGGAGAIYEAELLAVLRAARAALAAARAGGDVPTVTEWAVRQDDGFIGRGQIIPCRDEAEARASVECWTPVTREVTAWRAVPR